MKRLIILGIALLAIVTSKNLQAQDQTGAASERRIPLDNFYIKENNIGRVPQPFPHVREADVYLKRRIWRMIDFREKFNQFFYFPIQPVQDRVSFMSMVMKGLEDGSLEAFDDATDDFSKPLTFEELMAKHTRVVQRTMTDEDDPDITITRWDTLRFSNEDVLLLRLKEDWFIDRQRGVRDNRILGLAPVRLRFDDAGDFRGFITMFWLYYDWCRDVFVNTEAFNRHNSAQRMSYDDVFAMRRFFNSYIYKVDNQQDREIGQFREGQAVAREARRLAIELLNLEEDLWVY